MSKNSTNTAKSVPSPASVEREEFIQEIMEDEHCRPIPQNPSYRWFKEEVFTPETPATHHCNVFAMHIGMRKGAWNEMAKIQVGLGFLAKGSVQNPLRIFLPYEIQVSSRIFLYLRFSKFAICS